MVTGSLLDMVLSVLLVVNLLVMLLVFSSAATLALMELASIPALILVVGMDLVLISVVILAVITAILVFSSAVVKFKEKRTPLLFLHMLVQAHLREFVPRASAEQPFGVHMSAASGRIRSFPLPMPLHRLN
jgi:hypothetical protein